MSETITIEDVKRLDVQPGDVLLVTVPPVAAAQQADQIRAVFAEALPGVKIIVRSSDVDVEVVSEQRAIAAAVTEATANPGKTVEVDR